MSGQMGGAVRVVFSVAVCVAAGRVMAGCVAAPPVPQDSGDSEAFSRKWGRPCRGDSFYVDVPRARDVLWSDLSFYDGVKANLSAEIVAGGGAWFCTPGASNCPTGPVTVEINPVLFYRSSPPSREVDGHLRFTRIRFSTATDPALSVRPGKQCTVVKMIREAVETHAGATAFDDFYVGRECDAQAAGVEAVPGNDLLTWHLPAMGLPRQLSLAAPSAVQQTVDIALVDSGVLPAVGTSSGGIGLSSELDLFPLHAGLHEHGTAMAIFLRQVAPHAAIHSYRALAANGAGTSQTIAQALDHALFETGTEPLIINLSLAWPNELSRPSRMMGDDGCSSYENAFGEPVRYLLDLARELDESNTRRVFVAAAAGNEPLQSNTDPFPGPPSQAVLNPVCTPQSPTGGEWFYPALWHQIDTCHLGGASVRRVAFAVSAIDDRSLIGGISIPQAETPLVAPGQHVYAAHANAPLTAEAPVCGGAGSTFPPAVTLPGSFTGSSVSTAFVSAAAARAQAHRVANAQPALDNVVLARLLYLTGRAVCRNTPTGVPVRSLNVARLDRALAQCPTLIDCAASPSPSEVIPANLLSTCAGPLADCQLETLNGPGSCPPARAAQPWPQFYVSSRSSCSTYSLSGPWSDVSACSGSCAHEKGGAFRSLYGSLGPQPTGPACPDCPTMVSPGSPGTLLLIAELNAGFETGTTIDDPYLLLSGPSRVFPSITNHYAIALADATTSGAWTPGAHVEVQASLAGVDIDWRQPASRIVASLITTLHHSGAQVGVKDVSPLRVQVR